MVKMRIVEVLLASFSLIHNEVSGITGFQNIFSRFLTPKPIVQRSCIDVSARRTVLKPYRSEYNRVYENGSNNKGRSTLTAKLVDNIRAPFPSDDGWTETDRWLPIRPEESSGDDPTDDDVDAKKINDDPTNDHVVGLSVESKRIKDDLKDANAVITSIYFGLLALLCLKMNHFVHSYEFREDFEYYLDYGAKTVDFINIAATELMYYHNRKQIDIGFLLTLFYYSCGLKYTPRRQNEEIDRMLIKKKFIGYLLEYPYFYENDVYEWNEETVVKELKSKLKLIPEKSCASFGVTVSAMKMTVLTEPSEDEAVRIIQNRRIIVGTDGRTTVSDYIERFTREKDTDKIMTLHLNVLGVLVTHVFGYVSNCFELLGKLRNGNFDFDEDDKAVIGQLSGFMDGYMSIFLERYFEFKGEISQELVDAMFSIKYILDPSGSRVEDREDLTAAEKEALTEPAESDAVSMLNFYDKSSGDDAFDERMTAVIDDAVGKLLMTFAGNAPDDWNEPLKIDYGRNPSDKGALLNFMRKNNDDFYRVLVVFSCEFSIDKELYDKYELNKA